MYCLIDLTRARVVHASQCGESSITRRECQGCFCRPIADLCHSVRVIVKRRHRESETQCACHQCECAWISIGVKHTIAGQKVFYRSHLGGDRYIFREDIVVSTIAGPLYDATQSSIIIKSSDVRRANTQCHMKARVDLQKSQLWVATHLTAHYSLVVVRGCVCC